MSTRRVCPVCWQAVLPAGARKHIPVHFDSVGSEVCPATGQVLRITLPRRPKREAVSAVDTQARIRIERLERHLAS